MPISPSGLSGQLSSVPRTRQLIEQLQLQPHPEGGWYREVFRSTAEVMPRDGRPARSALTSIYFLLEATQHSRWHRVLSDEVWVHLEGESLDLWTWDAASSDLRSITLGPVSAATEPQHVVSAGLWQAAKPQGGIAGYALLACMVGPGFDFSDFQMMQPRGSEARQIAREHPTLASLA
ncbi:cupin domain-containing protein [Polaromonas aquatica]|uniref:cupin domain-containing protein n=1 Tax=Polaromonas aquatica TaxID=332657 RepID=UPI003D6605BE